MIYYIIPISISGLFILEQISSSKRENKIINMLFLLFLSLFILFVGALRTDVGTDWINYRNLFYYPEETLEKGYVILSYFVKYLGGDFHLFIFITFALAFYTKVWAFSKLSKSTLISILVYSGLWLLVYDLNGIRQGMALGFTSIATYYAYIQSKKGYFVSLAIAALMHYSVLIFLPFYFLLNIPFRKRQLILLLVIVFFIAYLDFMEFVLNIVMDQFFSGYNYYIEKLVTYSLKEIYNENVLFSFKMFHRLIIFIMTLLLIDRIPANERLKKTFLLAAFLNIFIFILLSGTEIVAVRTSLYYKYIECMFFSYLPFIFKKRLNQLCIAAIILIYILLNVYITLYPVDNYLIPYENLLF